MDSEQLAELRRQRELVARHLAWLDGEIVRLGAGSPPSSAAPTPVAVDPAAADQLTQAVAREVQATEGYSPDPTSSARDARRGCLWLAVLVLIVGALGLAAIYFVRYRDRPLLVPDRKASATSTTPATHK